MVVQTFSEFYLFLVDLSESTDSDLLRYKILLYTRHGIVLVWHCDVCGLVWPYVALCVFVSVALSSSQYIAKNSFSILCEKS